MKPLTFLSVVLLLTGVAPTEDDYRSENTTNGVRPPAYRTGQTKREENVKSISPQEAAKRINEKCTVELTVRSTGRSRDQTIVFLNSEPSFRDPKNFTIMLGRAALPKFKQVKIDDPEAHFKGKTIQVTGLVKLYKDRPEIVVDDPEQIVVMEKK